MKFISFFPTQPNFDFMGKRSFCIFLSACLMIAGIALFITKGDDKYGVDYRGGTEVVVKFPTAVDAQTIRDGLEKGGVGESSVQAFEKDSHEYSIRLGAGGDGGKDAPAAISAALKAAFPGDAAFEILKSDVVGPTIGGELRRKAIIATILGLLVILVYVSVRFEFAFALGAVVALLHDVVVCGLFYMLFDLKFGASTLAAALTIVGYSVNDTIVIFDRVREEIYKRKKFDLEQLMNECLNATLSRTILTSLLTLFSVSALLFLGGGAISDLSFFLFVGLITGSYSTIYVASPIVLIWDRYSQRKAKSKPAVATP